MADYILIWNLTKTAARIEFTEKHGLWNIDLQMPNVSIKAMDHKAAKVKAIRALKKYIVSMISDLESLEKRGE